MNDLSHCEFEILQQEGEFAVARLAQSDGLPPRLIISPVREQPAPASLAKLEHALALRDELDAAWAARPAEFTKFRGRPALAVEDPGGEPLDRAIDRPLAVPDFLCQAIGIASSLGGLHGKGFVHKDVKPANIIIKARTGEAWLTGFGLASRLPRHRQAPEPPEIIAGTLAYMAPEQTGRMNRSIDSRSDLYSLGVTFYEMLVGALPFTASDPMEWVHCHIARQPVAPALRRGEIPEPLSAIILKLLAKAPEARYQTAAGLETDLRHCLAAWESQGRIDPFPLGTRDASGQLLIPEKLYGREGEIASLLAIFDHVAAQGSKELVLVSGYSGVGKSSVVHELHRALVPPRGLFASGKFDQFQRDIPYATLTQAFRQLVRYVLGRSDGEIARWRKALEEALGQNGQLIVDLIPELELITGKQPPVATLPPQEAQSRFQAVFRRFLVVFAQAEHPLVLFLDDLQWLDAATLRLLPSLITEPDVHHLLLVGAYRDNEVDSTHPLTRALETSREAGASVQELQLKPLALGDIAQLMADALHCELARVGPLAQLVDEKAGGNPFFVIQFVTALEEEGLLTFQPETRLWQWDLSRIRGRGFTHNVIDLMSGKLDRLSAPTQCALSRFACLGNTAETSRLALIHGGTEEGLHAALWEALHAGFVSRSDSAYAFLHDRVQEAAYRLIPANEQAEVHLEIGRTLAAHTAPYELSEKIFEIVPNFNRGSILISSQEERNRVASLNLLAGKRAKAAGAYGSALTYLTTGSALLVADSWDRQFQLTFDLELHRAECEVLTGDLSVAEERLTVLSRRVENVCDQAAVACLRVDLYTNLDRAERAMEIGLEYLRLAGVTWSMHPTDEEVSEEFAHIWQQLGARSVEDILELPSMSDPKCRATLDVLTSLQGPAHFIDANLVSLVIGRMANLSLQHGNAAGSCFAYVYLGTILESRFGDYRRGPRFGRVGIHLSEKDGLDRFRARVYNNFGMAISPWANHVRASIDLLRRANDAAREAGDLTFMGYSHTNLISALLISGEPLSDVQEEAETALAFLRRAQFGTVADMVLTQLGLMRALRGMTSGPSTFSDAEFDESQFVRHLEQDAGLGMSACWYWIRKMQAGYLGGALPMAVNAAKKAEGLLWTSPNFIVMADYQFYAALVRLAQYDESSSHDRPGIWTMMETHRKMLAVWAESCPENFANRAALVEAEVARIDGRPLEAMELYERAIQSAKEQGFVQNEGLANELAARFHAARGFASIAETYQRNARYCYLRWGAEGKVRHLEQMYPHLRETQVPLAATSTIRTATERLDLATVVKISQTVSSEIVLDSLIEKLMKIAVEHVGAERGLLILFRHTALQIEAEATTAGDTVEVAIQPRAVTPAELPESILNYVIRTRESVVLDDASVRNFYSEDEYILRRRPRSILCLPIVKQAHLIGTLYLENNLTSHAFTSDRVAVLEVLASQAAISLENARLYTELEQENLERKRIEEELRAGEHNLRLIVNGIPGFAGTLNPKGEVEQCSHQLLEYYGKTLEEIQDRKTNNVTHPDDRARMEAVVEQAIATGAPYETEMRCRRADGVYRWFQCRGRPVRDTSRHITRWYFLITDIEDRKQAEEALRASERHLQRIINTIPTMVWSARPDGSCDFFNQRWLDYTGLTSEQALGWGWTTAFHPDDLPEDVLAYWQSCLTTGTPVDTELRMRRHDGVYRWFLLLGAPLRDDAGQIRGWYGTNIDIDDRKLADEKLRRSETGLRKAQAELAHVTRVTTMGELAASIAHEVNQPIAGVVINANACLRWLARLKDESPYLNEARGAAEKIIRDGSRAGEVIARIRALFKKTESAREPLDLNETIREIVSLARSEMTKQGVALQLELSAGLPKVLGDRVQIQQVLLNLILNAIDAMATVQDRAHDLIIRTRSSAEQGVLVIVRDSGIGLDPGHMDHIFTAFHTTKSGGLGMGLSISRSIVENHGGRLWASANDGLGATFQFALPSHASQDGAPVSP